MELAAIEFECPRCRAGVREEFYGPCDTCRSALRSVGGAAREVTVEAYEPKMNVVPNQVATKD